MKGQRILSCHSERPSCRWPGRARDPPLENVRVVTGPGVPHPYRTVAGAVVGTTSFATRQPSTLKGVATTTAGSRPQHCVFIRQGTLRGTE
jgi:hypothetical protein